MENDYTQAGRIAIYRGRRYYLKHISKTHRGNTCALLQFRNSSKTFWVSPNNIQIEDLPAGTCPTCGRLYGYMEKSKDDTSTQK